MQDITFCSPIPLRVLLVEDSSEDAELVIFELRRSGYQVEWKRVETCADYVASLPDGWDIVLSDYDLPQFDGGAALRLLQESGLDLPFVIVTGKISEQVAVDTMRQGADDYLFKDRLPRLGQAVAGAMERKRLRAEKLRAGRELERRVAERTADLELANQALQAEIAERQAAEDRAESIARFPAENPNPVLRVGPDGAIWYANEASAPVLAVWGCQVGQPVPPPWTHIVSEALKSGQRSSVTSQFGDRFYSFVVVPISQPGYVNLYARDVTQHLESEADREQLLIEVDRERAILDAIMANTGAHLAYLDDQFRFVRVNAAYARGSKYSISELIGRNHFELFPDPENQVIFERVLRTGQPAEYRARPFAFADQPERGITYWDWTLAPVHNSHGWVKGLVLSMIDVTRLERARLERDKYLARLNRLIDLSQHLLAECTLPGLLQRFVDAAVDLTEARIGAGGYSFTGSAFKIQVTRIVPKPLCFYPEGIAWLNQNEAYGKLLGERQTFRLTDQELGRELGWGCVPEGHTPLRGLLGARIPGLADHLQGLILVSDKIEGDFTGEDETLLGQLAAMASSALKHIGAHGDPLS